MTIIHQQAVVATAGWNETLYGRIEANGDVCYGRDIEFNLGSPGPNATARSYLWVVQEGGACKVYCAVNNSPNVTNQWYNTGGSPQGAPGTWPSSGAVILDIGEEVDSVNIYTVAENDLGTTGTLSFGEVGTFTDDDKTTFFAPSSGVDYGGYVDCNNPSTPPSANSCEGERVIQFTFRKSGRDDLTYTFQAHAYAWSEWEP